MTYSPGQALISGFGNGLDSSIIISGTATLVRDMNYENLTVSSTGVLVTAGFKVNVRNLLKVDAGGVIHNDGAGVGDALTAGLGGLAGTLKGGSAGGNGSGATAIAGSSSTDSLGGVGGSGGLGSGGAGAGGGSAASPSAASGGREAIRRSISSMFGLDIASTGVRAWTGGAGGGGGGGDGSAQGGGGGGGGGFILINARVVVNDGTIRANGGAGGARSTVDRGGGGGGGGGAIIINCLSYSGSGLVTANGGAGGTASGAGVAGRSGLPGTVFVNQIDKPITPAAFPLTIPWYAAYWASDPNWFLPGGDGVYVPTWVDAMFGNDAIQTTSDWFPTFRAAVATLNNKPAIQFDGVDDFLQSPAFAAALSQPYTLVSIIRPDGITGTHSNVSVSSTSTTAGMYIATGDYGFGAGTSIAGGTPTLSGHLMVGFAAGASSTLEVDGVVEIAADAGATTLGATRIGGRSSGVAPFAGYIAFVGIINRALTSQEKADLLAWSRSFYGTP